MARHNDIGRWGEDLAVKYLVEKGYIIRERDWHSGKKDLDIIALTNNRDTLVIVEVKTRSSKEIVDPKDALNRRKMKNIQFATHHYIREFKVKEKIRFDFIGIVGTNSNNADIEHIENAFNPLLL